MFCASLRRRQSVAGILNSLTLGSSLALREHDLRTHDIALPLSSHADPNAGYTRSSRHLRVLLLSPSTVSDAKLPSTVERIQRFASLTGGQDLAIVFLLYPGDGVSDEDSTAGMIAYTKLQAEIMNHDELPSIPTLPLPKLYGLAHLLKNHQAALAAPRPAMQQMSNAIAFDLLRHCTINPPMNDPDAFVITDLFPSLRELAQACTRAPNANMPSAKDSSDSRHFYPMQEHNLDGKPMRKTQETGDGSAEVKLQQLGSLQGDKICNDMVEFWRAEYGI